MISKKIIVKWIILSLTCCIATLVNATAVTVTTNANNGPGSLREAVDTVNSSPVIDEIQFNSGFNINLTTGSLNAFQRPKVTITGVPDLKIHQNNNPSNVIFNVGVADLTLVGFNETELNAEGNNTSYTNWYGSITGTQSQIVTFEQHENAIYPGIISGPLNLIYQGVGGAGHNTTTFTNLNLYAGNTSIIDGTLKVGITNALPTDTTLNVASPGILEVGDTFSQTLAGLSGNGDINIDGNGTLTIATAIDSTFGGVIGSTGTLIKDGTATLTLINQNTYEGGTNILNGALDVGVTDALLTTSTVNISDNGTLLITKNFSQTLAGLTGTGTLTINGTAFTLNTNSDSTFSGIITSDGNFIKDGTGTLTLDGPSTATGTMSITEGGIKISTNGQWSGPIIMGATTLEMNGGSVSQTITGAPTSTLNITDVFNPIAETNDVGSIHIRANGICNLNPGGSLRGFSNLNIHPGGVLNLESPLSIPASATFTNEGTFWMNGFNLYIGDNGIFNTGTLSTEGPIQFLVPAVLGNGPGYTINVPTGATLTVNNPITGYNALTVADNAEVILNPGGNLGNGITLASSIFTFNGGSYSGDVTGTAGSVMNVNSALIVPNAITVDTLNIHAGGILIPSTLVTTNTALNIDPGATLLLIHDILGSSGTVVNSGTITHIVPSTRTLAGNFRLEPGGVLDISILNSQLYSQLHVAGQTVLNGGYINLRLPPQTTIQNGDIFNIIISDGGITTTALPSVSKTSLLLEFKPYIHGNILQLIATRKHVRCINNIRAFDGVAGALDTLSQNNISSPLIRFLDSISSQAEFEDLLDQLAPRGLNGIYTEITMAQGATDQVLLRLDTLREKKKAFSKSTHIKTGYAAGDMIEDKDTCGPIVFGNSAKQTIREGVPGFQAFTGGFGIVKDISILEYYRMGFGLTYANSNIHERNHTGSHTTVGNTQGLLYGSATYDTVFLDAVFGGGINHYHGKRNIVLLGESVRANYKGFQYSAKIKTGCTIPCGLVEISPTATLYYLSLNVNRYTERGAPILNLSVNPMHITAVRTSFGGRIADIRQEECFLPEIHAYYICDIKNPNAIITSQFIAGGGAFISRGVKPATSGFNVGASISSLLSQNFLLSAHYDFEAKPSFKSHSLSCKFKWLF